MAEHRQLSMVSSVGSASLTEGILDHFVISIPNTPPTQDSENSGENPLTTHDPSCTNATLTGAGSGSIAPTTLVVEERVAEKEKPKEEAPSVNVHPEPTEPGAETSNEKEDLSALPKWRKWALFACSCLLQFLLQLDMAAVAVTLPVRSLMAT